MGQPITKVRIKQKDGQIWLRALIRHPMETGLRKDEVTGFVVPAHYVNHVIVETNGVMVFEGDWSTSIAENPFLSIKFDGAKGDTVRLSWTDNKGQGDTIEKVVGDR